MAIQPAYLHVAEQQPGNSGDDTMAGNIGINIGIAAPMAFFPFSGWKESFFGDLHGQSFHAVEFYTQTKVVIERWHDEWTRKF